MADCITKYDKDVEQREAMMVELVHRVLGDKSDMGKALRAGIGLHYRDVGTGNRALAGGFKQWIREMTGADWRKGGKLPTKADIAILNATLDLTEKQYREGVDYGVKMIKKHGSIDAAIEASRQDGKLIGKIMRMMPLTKRVGHHERVLRGKHVYDKVAMIKQRSEQKRGTAEFRVKNLMTKIGKLVGENAQKQVKAMAKVDAQAKKLNSRISVLNQMRKDGKLTDKFEKELMAAQSELDSVNFQRGEMLKSFDEHPINALSSSLIDIIEAAPNVRKQGAMTKEVADKLLVDEKQIVEIAGIAKDILDEFVPIGNETSANAKEIIRMHLERLGFNEAERSEIVDGILNFKEIKSGYFPRISVGTKDGIFLQDLVNKLSEQVVVDKKSTQGEITRLVADFMKHRTAEVEMEGRNRNMIDVLVNYGQQMLHTNYVTSVTRELEEQISVIWDLAKSTNGRDLDVYLEAYIREIDGLRRDTLGTIDHGTARTLSRIGHSAYVLAKLGALNAGGWVRNAAEGTVQIASAVGLKGLHNAAQIRREHAAKLAEYKAGEKTDFSIERFWTDEMGVANDRDLWVETLGEELADRALGVRAEHNEQRKKYLQAVEKGTGWLTSKLLSVGWSQTENGLRGFAHDVGSALGLRDAMEEYKPLFRAGRVPASTVKQYGLDPEKVRSNDEEVRMEEYYKLEKEMTNRRGFELMVGTQWNYDKMERHYIEGWAPGGLEAGKGIAMFQHYGVAWNSAMYLSFMEVKRRVKAGGFKAGMGASTRESRDSLFGEGRGMNQHANYLLSMMAFIAVGTLLEKEEHFGRKSALRIYGVAAHPFVKFFEGMSDALSGDKAKRNAAFFKRGALTTMTGPPVQDFINLLNIAMLESNIDTEDFPEWMSEGLKMGFGISTNEDYARWDNTDFESRADSVVEHLKRSTPFSSKGLPMFQHLIAGEGDGAIRAFARYVFNTVPTWGSRDSEEELTPEEMERQKVFEDYNRMVDEEASGFAQ